MQFHIGDLLTITTGRLVSPDHIGGAYRILGHMTGDNLMTHQLPQASEIAKPYLIDQHPWLAEVQPPAQFEDEAHVHAWVAQMVDLYGESHSVEPMPPLAWGQHDPIADLRAMTDKPIIGVITD